MQKSMPAIFRTVDKLEPFYAWVYKIFMFICKILLIADIVFTCVAVFARYLAQFTGIIINSSWCEEMVLTCMIYMAVLSAALAIRKGSHIRMTALDNNLPPVVVKVLDLVADIAVVILAIVMIDQGMTGALKQQSAFYDSLRTLSKFWMYFPIPLAGIAMILFELECIYNHIKAFFLPDAEEKKEA